MTKFDDIVSKLESKVPPSFESLVTKFEAKAASNSIWIVGIWVPGMFECGLFCTVIKKVASVNP